MGLFPRDELTPPTMLNPRLSLLSRFRVIVYSAGLGVGWGGGGGTKKEMKINNIIGSLKDNE